MLSKGDRVLVALPKTRNVVGIVHDMWEWDGKEAIVSEVHIAYKQTSSYTMVALEGCVSDYGMPYWFAPEWLIELESEVSA